jgi:hypothetical protein
METHYVDIHCHPSNRISAQTIIERVMHQNAMDFLKNNFN